MDREAITALVAGAGSIGRRHARNLQTLGVDVVAFDPDDDARAAIGEDLGIQVYSAFKSALAAAEPDIVVVSAPNRYHVELATVGARADCHLFVEKPLSHTMEGVRQLESIADDRDLVSLVGSNLRFLPEMRKMRELLGDDVVGPIRAARVEGGSYLPKWFPKKGYREAYSARTDLGGGVVLDYIHEINYARWLLGEFETVSGMAGQLSDLDVETNDVAAILARRSDGMVCEFHLDYIQRAESRSCHIIGEKGTIRWSWPNETVKWYVADDGWHSFERPEEWKFNDMYVDEMEHFIEAVSEGTETVCSISCGRRDLEIALAARESSETGRHVAI